MAGPTPRSIKTSEIKNKILNLAQTSVFQVKVQPPAAVETYLADTGKETYRTNGRNIDLLCSETSLPGNSFTTHEVTNDFMGVTEKMAYRRMYDETIDMTFYVDKRYNVIEFFDGWMEFIGGGSPSLAARNGYRMSYPKSYKTNIYLTKFEKDISEKTLFYTFVDAFPISVVSTPVSYAASDILRYNVSFSYVRYVKQSGSSSPFTANTVIGDVVRLPNGQEIPLNVSGDRFNGSADFPVDTFLNVSPRLASDPNQNFFTGDQVPFTL